MSTPSTRNLLFRWLREKKLEELQEFYTRYVGCGYPSADRLNLIDILCRHETDIYKEHPSYAKLVNDFLNLRDRLRAASRSFSLMVSDEGDYFLWIRSKESLYLDAQEVLIDAILAGVRSEFLLPPALMIGNLALSESQEEIFKTVQENPGVSSPEIDKILVRENNSTYLLGRLLRLGAITREKKKGVYHYTANEVVDGRITSSRTGGEK